MAFPKPIKTATEVIHKRSGDLLEAAKAIEDAKQPTREQLERFTFCAGLMAGATETLFAFVTNDAASAWEE